MQLLFFSLSKTYGHQIFKVALIENALCRARECYYYITLVKPRQKKLISHNTVLFFSFANAIVRFTNIDLIFLKCRTKNSYKY